MAIFKRRYAKKIGLDLHQLFLDRTVIGLSAEKKLIKQLFSEKGILAARMLKFGCIGLGDEYRHDDYRLLAYLLENYKLDDIIKTLWANSGRRLKPICDYFDFDVNLDVHPNLSDGFVFQLFHKGYTSFNTFMNSYGKVIFDSICDNRLYQKDGIDYSEIKRIGFEEFKKRYHSDEVSEQYSEFINTFDSMMLTIFKLYPKKYLEDNREEMCKRISSGYLYEQMVGNRLCYPNGMFDKYADGILLHLDDETFPLLMRSERVDKHCCSRVDFPIAWYLNNIEKLLESNASLSEEQRSELIRNQAFFQDILRPLSKGKFGELYEFIKSQDPECNLAFSNKLKEAIISYQKMARTNLINNTRSFASIKPKKTTYTSSFKGLSRSIDVDAIVVDSYSDLKGALIRKVSIDDFEVPDPREGSQFFEDAFEFLGANYESAKSHRSDEEYKKIFYNIAQMIFEPDKDHFNQYLQDLHTSFTEEEFEGFLKFYSERSLERNSVIRTRYNGGFSRNTIDLVERLTSGFTKPLLTRTSCDEPYSYEIHEKLKELVREPRAPKDKKIPVDYINVTSSNEYDNLLPDDYTLALSLNRNYLDPENTYIVNSDPCSDLPTSPYSTPKKLIREQENKRKNTFVTKRAFDTYCDQIYVDNTTAANEALVLFHSAFIDDNMLTVIERCSKIAKELKLPLVLVNNDGVKNNIDYQRKQCEKLLEPKEKPESKLVGLVLEKIQKYSGNESH